jgi:iron-sulfur cluster repair protein YtfE (RIC family)
MSESRNPAEGRRQELLEKLQKFEDAAGQIHPEQPGSKPSENLARFREAASELHKHLSRHLATRETAEWPALPDSDQEISAFAEELKAEHKSLMEELSQLASAANEMDSGMDRTEFAGRIREQSRVLALRIARHAGEAEAPLGKYLRAP